MHLNVSYEFLPKQMSLNASVVMDHFGIDFEQGSHIIAQDLELPIEAGDAVFFTGPSGSGKSSLMRAAAAQLDGVLDAASLDLPESILVDGLGLPAQEALALLAACGLSEAQVLLRTPGELSDGQRYRYRLALALSRSPPWIVADEFTAALDRPLAKIVARMLRKAAGIRGIGLLLATTHDDLIEDLQPSLLVRCRGDGTVEWSRGNVSKKVSASRATCGSREAPSPTGRIFRAGTIADIMSASCGS